MGAPAARFCFYDAVAEAWDAFGLEGGFHLLQGICPCSGGAERGRACRCRVRSRLLERRALSWRNRALQRGRGCKERLVSSVVPVLVHSMLRLQPRMGTILNLPRWRVCIRRLHPAWRVFCDACELSDGESMDIRNMEGAYVAAPLAVQRVGRRP